MLICVFGHAQKTPLSLLPNHRKYRCFGSILRLREKENIVNSVVLSSVGAKNIANYDALGTFVNGKGEISLHTVFLFLRICVVFLTAKTS